MTLLEEAAPGRPGKRERPGGKVVALVIVLLVALVAGGYVVAHQVAGDKVPRGTTVSGRVQVAARISPFWCRMPAASL